MGSTGWFRCYWCEKWEYNGYIPDGMPGALCIACVGRICDGQFEPVSPNAVCHRVKVIWLVIPSLRQMPDPVLRHIAYFLEADASRPGRGSRRTPPPATYQFAIALPDGPLS